MKIKLSPPTQLGLLTLAISTLAVSVTPSLVRYMHHSPSSEIPIHEPVTTPASDVKPSTGFTSQLDVADTSEPDISNVLSSDPTPVIGLSSYVPCDPLERKIDESATKLRQLLGNNSVMSPNNVNVLLMGNYREFNIEAHSVNSEFYLNEVLKLADLSMSYGVDQDYLHLPDAVLSPKVQASIDDYNMHRTLLDDLIDYAYDSQELGPTPESVLVGLAAYKILNKSLPDLRRPNILLKRIYNDVMHEKFPGFDDIEFNWNVDEIGKAQEVFKTYFSAQLYNKEVFDKIDTVLTSVQEML
jgi:hypothetical protein